MASSSLTGVLQRKGRNTRDMDAQRKGYVRTWEDGHPQAQERGLRRNQTCWHLDLGLLAPRTVRNTFLSFKTPCLWDFVMVACCAAPRSPAILATAQLWDRRKILEPVTETSVTCWTGYLTSQRQRFWSHAPHPTLYGCTAKGRQDTAAIFATQGRGGGDYQLQGPWLQKSSLLARATGARAAVFLLMTEYTGAFLVPGLEKLLAGGWANHTGSYWLKLSA